MLNSAYSLLLKQAEALISSESDPIANAANLSSLIYHHVDDVNWVGFYFYREGELVLGPFSGQPACTRIPVGKGVCGTAYEKNETQLIADVHSFAGHIACDAASESEVVVPFKTDTLSGVFDIDSPRLARFTAAEKALFEGVRDLFVKSMAR
ncbi:GAF domain-containing protein [Arenicella sp. 4NH20-0111]|uniref:GAF domain-containing protein n=1 Tax=Arenicella sp. 4NH20-0111 TaxID=3127648 RepID=UPI003105BDEE